MKWEWPARHCGVNLLHSCVRKAEEISNSWWQRYATRACCARIEFVILDQYSFLLCILKCSLCPYSFHCGTPYCSHLWCWDATTWVVFYCCSCGDSEYESVRLQADCCSICYCVRHLCWIRNVFCCVLTGYFMEKRKSVLMLKRFMSAASIPK